MQVPSRHILAQTETLSALGRVLCSSVERPFKPKRATGVALGTRIEARLPARSVALVHDYVRHLHGEPSAYGDTLPPHLFPQWTFNLVTRALEQSDYPLSRVINLGGGFRVHHPLPASEELFAACSLIDVKDDGTRAIVTARVVTGTKRVPEALSADVVSLFPLRRRGPAGGKQAKVFTSNLLPARAERVASLTLDRAAGLNFGKLTGDFNPIHWLPPAARAAGFGGIVLQGNGTIAHTLEALNRTVFAGDVHRLQSWSCQLMRPVLLPSVCSVWVDACQVYVVEERKREVVLRGEFTTASNGAE